MRALDIAHKILKKAGSADEGELITNLKLQKMLYYMQGFHLACFDTPLFDEEIEAWQYGPVVPSVYDHFKEHKSRGIEYDGETIDLSDREESLFNEVYRVYGKFSAIGLMNMTHEEMPWKTTPTGVGNVIPHEKMKEFFKKRLE
jgi:uncharacterized phage-associated protein